MKIQQTCIAAAISALVLSACSSDSGTVVGPGTGGPDSSGVSGRLKAIDNSDAFYGALRDALIAQSETFYPGGLILEADVDFPATAPPQPNAAPDASDNASSEGQGAGERNEVTSTNVQELGVDEQDRVKISSDGNRLIVLQSAYPYDFPTIDLPVPVDGEAPVVGAPMVEPVADEFSTSFFAPQSYTTTLRVMALDSETPDASELNSVTVDLQGRYADGFYLYETESSTSALLTSSGGGYWLHWAEPTSFAGLDSVITRVDLTNPAAASVSGTFRIDGQIISSRRIGKHLFFASRYYPAIPGDQPWLQNPEQWRQTVDATDMATLLPQYTNDESATVTPLVDPAGCFVADKAQGNDYYSPDIITLGVIDLDTMALTDSECYLGATETLYASTEAVYLATTQYDYSTGPVAEDGRLIDVAIGTLPVDIAWHDPRVNTDIHQFDINEGGQLVYAGSGSVRGHLGWSELRKPFRMSEHAGYLRVASFNDQQGMGQSPIIVSVLQADGAGNLRKVSELPNESRPEHIGKPGEQLYASRFLGDRAYLVTFRQTDPLYIIDLADPAAPYIAGDLEIAGYSDYLHPIGRDYLLGIGKDAVAAPDGRGDGRGALVQGLKLSLFDVSNPAQPSEVQSVLVGQRGTDSNALYNHRAITVQAATESHPTRVSFGINVYGRPSPTQSPSPQNASTYYNWTYSGLHGFDVNVGDSAGITPRGALIVESASNSSNPYGPRYADDRSVMVNDSVFYIYGPEVYAAPWDDLANPSAAR